ncbi:glycoside hydrolase family 3 C-terminal domain-containing protein [Sphingomonas sp. RRHST34]|uniref:Glycoside hydrolase family 3 C-terminal domain-containing protein n=1 Tax=Sphingomonas citri TaxID=2862499 RepID=A0ABS7BSQ6_9SPHN|nr:glycoside hydrolase family 3 C-terminal domain-containing protein [Sphingomonas citri]MBW6532550.1 glycoside hydrolase family 3 C-terminal domain-containing protein [Sphingomonas citri]
MLPLLLIAAQADTAAPAIERAIAAMSLEEKAAQLGNAAPALPAAELPAYDYWSEGLHGLARNGVATVFPQAIGLAASWDVDLLRRVGDVVSTEARAKYNALPRGAARPRFAGLHLWSPNINIFRDPRWGRGQETYGEDPYLTGRLGVAFVRGVQGPDPASPKAIATPKHLAVHSGPEAGRNAFDVDVSPRDMAETYTPAFRLALTEGGALSTMCAYNALHGVPACASTALLNERVRARWRFGGMIVSDCDAVGYIESFHNYRLDLPSAAAAALRAGTDLDCGPSYDALPAAVRQGLVSEAEIDTALRRVLGSRAALGIAFGRRSRWDRIRPDQVDTPAHRALAVEAAEKSLVLLTNKDRLPLAAGTRLAVIGANADSLDVLEANYHGTAAAPVTPLEGIRARFGAARVRYAQGSVLAEGVAVPVPETALSADGRPGLRGEYFRGAIAGGRPLLTRQDRVIDFDWDRAPPARGLEDRGYAVRWTGQLTPPAPGTYTLRLEVPRCFDCDGHDPVRLWVDGKPVIADRGSDEGVEASVTFADARPRALRVELDHVSADGGIGLRWVAPAAAQLAEAVAAARDADVVVAFAGLSPTLEGEALRLDVPGFVGGDRTKIELPEPQRALLAALAATGKPLVVVQMTGAAIADPWTKATADAAVAAWYPGQAGGTAIARLLAGDISPSGRLPVTFYAATRDMPAYIDYSMKNRTYRFFTGTPLYPFGHGLSYTRFAYAAASPAAVTIAAGAGLGAAVRVTNTGARAGDAVVQAYLAPVAPQPQGRTVPVLQRQLVGFARASLAPGESREVRLTIDPRSLSLVARDGTRAIVPGAYRLFVGGGQPGDADGAWTELTITGERTVLPE